MFLYRRHTWLKTQNYTKSSSLFKNKVSNKMCLQIGGKKETEKWMILWELGGKFINTLWGIETEKWAGRICQERFLDFWPTKDISKTARSPLRGLWIAHSNWRKNYSGILYDTHTLIHLHLRIHILNRFKYIYLFIWDHLWHPNFPRQTFNICLFTQ